MGVLQFRYCEMLMRSLVFSFVLLMSGCSSLLPSNPTLSRDPVPLSEELKTMASPGNAMVSFTSRLVASNSSYKEYEYETLVEGQPTLKCKIKQTRHKATCSNI